MKPEELLEDDFERDSDPEYWDDDLGLEEWDESETQSVARELGIVTSKL